MNEIKLSRAIKRNERGQALVLIAIAFIALLAFVGLVVDVGTLFIQYGHLRRAVDAASLSAAAQFREFHTVAEMTATAQEFLRLNGVNDAAATVEVCDPTAVPIDITLCTSPYLRKLVRVSASLPVRFSFLPVIGISTVNVSASAVGEAASLDVILVLDRSASMASDNANSDPTLCNPSSCQPFESVRAAAAGFINNLYFPYDRLAIVSFDRAVSLDQPLTTVKADALTTLNSLTVFPTPGNPPCDYNPNPPDAPLQPDPSGCTTTNIGGGLLGAASALTDPSLARYDSLWVVVLLTDGAANHTVAQVGFPNGYCPASTWFQPGCNTDPVTGVEYGCPICRDIAGIATYHDSSSPDYDAEDYAVDQADTLVALRTDSLGASEMIIFTIGLGDQVTNTTYGKPDAGQELLEYIADAADGSYYASPTAADLVSIFSDIAQNIFTRITQ
jgi:Flp pilus assembly protein TadG